MKFFKITVFSFFALAACGSLRAQDLRGVVRDAENQPLVGASVYWAGTTIGASTDAQGAFLLHRVKGYDKLVASYLGFVNDTLDVWQTASTRSRSRSVRRAWRWKASSSRATSAAISSSATASSRAR